MEPVGAGGAVGGNSGSSSGVGGLPQSAAAQARQAYCPITGTRGGAPGDEPLGSVNSINAFNRILLCNIKEYQCAIEQHLNIYILALSE